MDRINGSGTIDIGGGRRGFRDENLGAGVEGTEVTALFLNMLQEEVSKVIEDAGLVLNPADWTQLLQALRLKFSGRNAKAWIPVISMTITAPPATPAVGDIYLVPSAATDGWVGKAGFLAEWIGTSWVFTPPPNGHGISLPNGQVFLKIAGSYVEWLASRDWVNNRKTPLAQLTSLPWVPVLSMTLSSAPGAPAVGDTYLIPAGASGIWTANIGKIAEWNGTAWSYATPPNGHGISLPDGRVFQRIGGIYIEKIAIDAQSGKSNFAVASGTANDISATFAPVPASWGDIIGMPMRVLMTSSPTGAATFNPNGLGKKSIVKRGGGAIADKEWLPNDIVELMYDGTVVRMIAAQRVGLDAAGFQTYSANVTLTILDLGKCTNLNQACATVILPKASSCPSGSIIALHNTRQGLTNAVQAAAGDDITIGAAGAGSGLTSFTMANQESVLLVAFSASNNWVAVTGSAQARYTPGFSSSLGSGPGTAGFKRIPDPSSPTGYIIEQWGYVTAAAANTNQAVTLPVAFPNAFLHATATSGSVSTMAGASSNGSSPSNLLVWASNAGASIFWRALGY